MSYIPSGTIEDPAVLAELLQISRAVEDLDARIHPKIYAEPEKPREGMVVFADGTIWNPGSGEGLYLYAGAKWVQFSGGSGDADALLFFVADD